MTKLVVLTVFSVFVSLFLLPPMTSYSQETLTITTYYPSPDGSYRRLEWGDLPNRSRGLLSEDQGSSIVLGGLTPAGAAGTPYIDFANDMGASYDMRIKLAGNNDLEVTGGQTTFRNNELANDTTSPAIIKVKEVWYCSRY